LIISIHTFISSSSDCILSNSFCNFNRAVPPQATIPSSIAALVAFKASSILSFLFFISASVAAQTLITATPPASLAILSCNFS
jgi:hypothetical protein